MKVIESIAKKAIGNRWREGVSLYYLHLYEKNYIPKNVEVYTWFFMKNINKPSGKLNYKKKLEKTYDYEIPEVHVDIEDLLDMNIDLKDENIIDFLTNNPNTDSWIKLYKIIYKGEIQFNLFEEIMLDYILSGLSIKEISKITGNSISWVYQYRKNLIDKIKERIKK